MIMMKHAGIYVRDLGKMTSFYAEVFSMKVLFREMPQQDALTEELLGKEDGSLLISKLITPFGEEKKAGDMLELIRVTDGSDVSKSGPLTLCGTAHVAFGVDDMEETVRKAEEKGGKLKTKIHCMENGRKCAFLTDPEGNWIELIG